MIEVNYNEYKETIAENMRLIIENHDLKEKIEDILNNKREIMLRQMLQGSVDYEEILYQVDEEIRQILKDSDKE